MPARPRPKAPPQTLSTDIRRALDALRRIVQGLRAGAPSQRLTTAQLFALQQIHEHPLVSINGLAALTYTHQSSVSVVVRRLVERGLVVKVAAAGDRRRQSLTLTARGRRLIERTPPPAQERLIDAIGRLPRTECRQLVRSLEAIAQAVSPPTAARRHPPMLFEEE